MSQPRSEQHLKALLARGSHSTLKTFRTGVIRQVDELGRVVLAIEYRKAGNIQTKDVLIQSLVVDVESGRLVGILLEPADWVLSQDGAPKLIDMLNEIRVTAIGPELDLR